MAIASRWTNYVAAALMVGAVGCSDRAAVTSPGTDVPLTIAQMTPTQRNRFVSASDEVGCGLVLATPTGEKQLAFLRRSSLPSSLYSQSSGRVSRSGRRAYQTVDISLPSTTSYADRIARCVVPIESDLTTARALLREAVSRKVPVIAGSALTQTARSQAPDDKDAALYLPIFETAIPFSMASSPASSTGRPFGKVIGVPPSLYDAWGLQPVVVTGTITGTGVVFNFGDFNALIRSIWGLYGTVTIQWNGFFPDCEDESELYLALQDALKWLNDAEQAFVNANAPDISVANRAFCPDSLMQPGETCADFYIAALTSTFMGVSLAGDNRDPNALATKKESKVQFVPHFDNPSHTYDLLINGSILLDPVPSYPVIFPETAFQVSSLTIDTVDTDHRKVTLKLSNAACGQTLQALHDLGLDGMSKLADMACPHIDAELNYTREGTRWVPTTVVRDGYPTLDVWRKESGGGWTLLDSRHETNTSALFGISKMKYEIQHKLDEINNDQTCSLQ